MLCAGYGFSSPILTSTPCVSELQLQSEFLAMNTPTVHTILSALIYAKWRLQMQAILLLVPAQVDSLQMEKKKNSC